jgi:hypothetical protein
MPQTQFFVVKSLKVRSALQSNGLYMPVPLTFVFATLEFLFPLDKKLLVSLYDGNFVLEIITVGFQAICLRPVLSLLSENDLILFFHLSLPLIDHFLLFSPPIFPSLDELLVFPAQLFESL